MKFKENLKKNIRKYIPVLCTLFLIPCISFNAFAYSAEYHLYPKTVPQYYSSSSLSDIHSRTYEMSKDINNVFVRNFSGGALTYNKFLVGDVFNNFTYPYDSSLFDYYVLGSFTVNYKDISVVNSFDLSNIYLYENIDSNWVKLNTNSFIDKSYNLNSTIFSFNFPLESFSDLSVFEFEFNPAVVYTDRSDASVSFEVSVLAVAKDTSADSVQSIISAINNQTSSLGDKIDDTNDLIENGDSDTQSAVSDFNQVFEDFNEELENWEQFDDQIIGEFNSANEDYKTELNNFSLSGSLLNAGNWLSTSMQTVYDNSSDYKMLWLVPLLFGIPILLFIIRKNGDDE